MLRRWRLWKQARRDRALFADLLSGDGERVMAAAAAFTAAHPDAGRRSELCSQLVEVLRDSARPVGQRVSAGDALGELDDPRFDPACWFLPREEAAGFLEIPAGTFPMGSDPRRDPMADRDELLQHPVSLPTYYMARYPVTVRQFREFAADVLKDRGFDDPGYRTHRPVMSIAWVDARAYCTWIEKRLTEVAPDRLPAAVNSGARAFWQGLAEGRLRIRLPSEAEWEKAARGAGARIFPWGDVHEPGRANTAEAGVLRPTAVGAMPGGAAESGCEDLSGNVWELTRSPYVPYPFDPAGEADLENDPNLRVTIRGGSFLGPARLARCATRDGVPKGREGQDLGFRLAAAPVTNEARRRQSWPGITEDLASLPPRLRTRLLRAVGTEERFARNDEASLMDESVEAWQSLVTDHAFPFTEAGFQRDVLCDAGRVRLLRYRSRRGAGDLQQAVNLLKAASETSPEPDPDVLVNLAHALRERHAMSGDPVDLEEAIRMAAAAIEAAGGSSARAAGHVALGLSLTDRYRRQGRLADLERAIDLFIDALPAIEPSSPERASVLNDLGLGYGYLFERTRQADDIGRAVEAFEAAVRETVGSPPELPVRLHNLGKALAQSYRETGDVQLLARAIDASRRGTEMASLGSVDLPMLLEGRAEGLFLRHLEDGDPADLDRAIDLWERAAHTAPPDGPGRITSLAGLTEGLIARHGLTRDAETLERARALLRDVCSGGLDRTAEQAWKSARKWIEWAFGRGAWEEVAEAWPHADLALSRLLAVQRDRPARETWLREVGAATREAGYAVAKAGGLDAAAVVLERGLARLLAASLRAGRERPETKPAEISDLHAAVRVLGDRAALVYLATTGSGSVALVVTAERVEAVWAELSASQLDAFLVRREGESLAGGYLPGVLSSRREATAWLNEALSSLGEVLGGFMGTLADRLLQMGIEQVVLLPAGRLRALPLHVVPYERDGRSIGLFEDFVVTHAPNAITVQAAVAAAARREAGRRLVVVGNPLPNPFPLPAAEAEAREISAMFPGSRLFIREAATRESLVAAAGWCGTIHFGCHGLFDLDEPLDSRLQLAGADALTLRDFLDRTVSLPAARLAVLSACQSAVAEPFQLADEVVSLPAGLLQCGVPGVIGTLWPVADVSTAMVMVKLYELLRNRSVDGWPPLHPAAALAEAQRWLRDATPGELQSFLEAHPALLPALGTENRALPVHLGDLLQRDIRKPLDPPYSSHPYHWAPFVYYGV